MDANAARLQLHPLVVVIGVVGGAILFGPAGMFLAIPTTTVVRVLVASGARHLTAYGVIRDSGRPLQDATTSSACGAPCT